MAQYKVPQDVEADDKLIGPFNFRQFVYLLVAGGLIALTVGLFQLFPLVAILPIPFALFFLALALPLKKDQPMETYLAAVVSYYIKPRTRLWKPGQKESTILITAPKIVEDVRTRNISGEEATHRLSFLADIVDSEGFAIKGSVNNSMREDLIAEANAMNDMFDSYQSGVIAKAVDQEKDDRHQEAIREMREAIQSHSTSFASEPETIVKGHGIELRPRPDTTQSGQDFVQDRVESIPRTAPEPVVAQAENPVTKPVNNSIMELANNSDYTVATIAKEANRINRKDDSETFVSLH